MELLTLVLLYYLSQNPDFSESVKPLMAQLKDSQQMLSFLKDLSNFSQTFGYATEPNKKEKTTTSNTKETPKQEEKENPQSPTKGIADEFIQGILDSYFKKS
jgi:hypothetical protein